MNMSINALRAVRMAAPKENVNFTGLFFNCQAPKTPRLQEDTFTAGATNHEADYLFNTKSDEAKILINTADNIFFGLTKGYARKQGEKYPYIVYFEDTTGKKIAEFLMESSIIRNEGKLFDDNGELKAIIEYGDSNTNFATSATTYENGEELSKVLFTKDFETESVSIFKGKGAPRLISKNKFGQIV